METYKTLKLLYKDKNKDEEFIKHFNKIKESYELLKDLGFGVNNIFKSGEISSLEFYLDNIQMYYHSIMEQYELFDKYILLLTAFNQQNVFKQHMLMTLPKDIIIYLGQMIINCSVDTFLNGDKIIGSLQYTFNSMNDNHNL